MTESRVAVYVCGNEQIYFPAIVALTSIQHHNPEAPFDYFISFSKNQMTPKMRNELRSRNITFIPRERFANIRQVEFENMAEGKWPSEIWDNWIAPLYFRAEGYPHALKVDYDVLCLSPYSTHEMFGSSEVFRGVVMSVDLQKDNVNHGIFETLGYQSPSNLQDAPYCNVGVLGFNTKNYEDTDFITEYSHAYQVLRNSTPTVSLCEQAALSVMMTGGQISYGTLNPNYNVRIITRPPITDDGRADIRNLHFITHNKPWLQPNYRWFDNYVSENKTIMYLYRACWLAAASRDPLASEYLNFDPEDQLLQLGTIIKIFNAHVE